MSASAPARRVGKALADLRRGRPVLLYDADDRERETDFVQAAPFARPADVARFRRDGGGLICVAVHPGAAERLGLPFMTDVLRKAAGNGMATLRKMSDLRLPYDARSSFSLWVNHRETFTGVTDQDRARTIRELGRAVEEALRGEAVDFGERFRSPGHVSICRAAEGLLGRRQGQTELSVALALMAGVPPAMVMCEMMDGRTGNALSKGRARAYGERHGLVWLQGAEVVEAFSALAR
ncbi:MAG: 3,4-dihydroxy-2-butanone-4-phosphate synthase [Halobacteria archaeon]